MAPGANIISSTNSYYFETNPESNQWNDLVGSYDYNGRTYYWKADTGTSMSSPFVGGAIALWLEAKPDLTREEIIDVFADTCTHPDESLSYPNNLYGYGQIDVYGGLLHILGIDSIKGISRSQPKGVSLSVVGKYAVNVAFDAPLLQNAEVKIYSAAGQILKAVPVPAGSAGAVIPLPHIAGGIYVVQINGGTDSTTGSVLLRI